MKPTFQRGCLLTLVQWERRLFCSIRPRQLQVLLVSSPRLHLADKHECHVPIPLSTEITLKTWSDVDFEPRKLGLQAKNRLHRQTKWANLKGCVFELCVKLGLDNPSLAVLVVTARRYQLVGERVNFVARAHFVTVVQCSITPNHLVAFITWNLQCKLLFLTSCLQHTMKLNLTKKSMKFFQFSWKRLEVIIFAEIRKITRELEPWNLTWKSDRKST